ncbi:MAG: hypothetical protein JO275_13240 [Verrucomicrobia bacterium]|nr:hypothetical protein [Verrucomicrobiota bacterium]
MSATYFNQGFGLGWFIPREDPRSAKPLNSISRDFHPIYREAVIDHSPGALAVTTTQIGGALHSAFAARTRVGACNRLQVTDLNRRDALGLWWGEAPGRRYD